MTKICKEAFSKVRGKQPFDWNKFLMGPKPAYGSEKEAEINALATGWVTCAAGNQCAKIPRYKRRGRSPWGGVHQLGEPKDAILCQLGVDFGDNIIDQEWPQARVTLAKIERRSASILRDMDRAEAAVKAKKRKRR